MAAVRCFSKSDEIVQRIWHGIEKEGQDNHLAQQLSQQKILYLQIGEMERVITEEQSRGKSPLPCTETSVTASGRSM
jgi:hypothetical protein